MDKRCLDLLFILLKFFLYIFTLLLSVSLLSLLYRLDLVLMGFYFKLFGIALIIFAFWYIYEGREYQLDTNVSFSISSIAFIIGIVLICISTCGFIGVLRENLFLSKMVCLILKRTLSAITAGLILTFNFQVFMCFIDAHCF